MASLLRAWAAIVATGILIAAPAAADTPDPAAPAPAAPEPAAPATAAPATAASPTPPAPAPVAAPGRRVAQPRAAWRPRRAPAAPKAKVVDVLPPEGTPIASSPTFARLEDGKSRIFMEVNRKVNVVESRAPGRVTYRLHGTAVVQRTNQLALPTGFFTTPVNRVQLVQQGSDLDLVIELRETTDFAYHVIETPRGMALWVDFPQSQTFGRDDGTWDSGRTRAKRGTTTQKIHGAPPPDDSPLMDDR